ncbi:dispersed gene family protein 1 (DGF-1), putative, partial [Trypanosoma cruzi]
MLLAKGNVHDGVS